CCAVQHAEELQPESKVEFAFKGSRERARMVYRLSQRRAVEFRQFAEDGKERHDRAAGKEQNVYGGPDEKVGRTIEQRRVRCEGKAETTGRLLDLSRDESRAPSLIRNSHGLHGLRVRVIRVIRGYS